MWNDKLIWNIKIRSIIEIHSVITGQLIIIKSVRPLPVPELPVKSDGIYQATL